MMHTGFHFWVTGRVQRVFFRVCTRDKARSLGLTGWVKNLADGRVEGAAYGDEAALNLLKDWLASGPEFARVTHLDVQPEKPEPCSGFEIR